MGRNGGGNDKSNKFILGGEGKCAMKLPIKPTNSSLSKKLCWYGLRTTLCRQEDLPAGSEDLRLALKVKASNDNKQKLCKRELSEIAKHLVESPTIYADEFDGVNKALQNEAKHKQ